MSLAALYVLGYRVQAAVVVAAVVAPLVGLVALAWRWRLGERWRALGFGGLASSSVVLAALVLSPDTGRRRPAACSFALDLGGSLWAGDQRTVNVVMFLPLGFFAVVLARPGRQRLLALALAAAVSPIVEQLQRTPLVNRTCDVTDLVDNLIGLSLGAVLGLVLVVVGDHVRRRGWGRREPEGQPPSDLHPRSTRGRS